MVKNLDGKDQEITNCVMSKTLIHDCNVLARKGYYLSKTGQQRLLNIPQIKKSIYEYFHKIFENEFSDVILPSSPDKVKRQKKYSTSDHICLLKAARTIDEFKQYLPTSQNMKWGNLFKKYGQNFVETFNEIYNFKSPYDFVGKDNVRDMIVKSELQIMGKATISGNALNDYQKKYDKWSILKLSTPNSRN